MPDEHDVDAVPLVRVASLIAKPLGELVCQGLLVAAVVGFLSYTLSRSNELRPTTVIVACCASTLYVLVRSRNLLKQRSRSVFRRSGPLILVAVAFAICLATDLLAGPQGVRGNTDALVALVTRAVEVPVAATATASPREILLRDVTMSAKWSRGTDGSVLLADFTLANPSEYKFKDFQIRCIYYAPSGTALRANTAMIYEVMDPKSTTTFKKVNMGFVGDRSDTAGCTLKDFTMMP